MGEKGLDELVLGLFAADGFAVEQPEPYGVLARRGQDQRFVWLWDPEHTIAPDPGALIADFEAARPHLGGPVQGLLVARSLDGLSADVRRKAADAGIGIRVPVQLFDTPYKSDADAAVGSGRGRGARSVFEAYLRRHQDLDGKRVPQPYEALRGLGDRIGGFGSGADLLPALVEELTAAHDGPCLTLVLGNAGAGKSVLFAALFAALHKRFAAEKRHQRPASRPILFLPEHIREANVGSLDGLLEAVAVTDAAAPTRPGLMRFLNREGFTTWMFDGLDEFFAGETDFLEAVSHSLAPGSRARIVICTRDSLIASSTALRGLVDRHLPDGTVRLYELGRWQRPSQRALAFVRLEGSLPGVGDTADPPRVAGFLAVLDGSPGAQELATLPYYCDLMLARGERGAVRDELELLADAVDGLIDREAEKLEGGELGFRWDVFSGADNFVDVADLVAAWGPDALNAAGERERLLAALERIGRERLVELIEGIAHQARMTVAYPNEGAGLATEEIEDLANYYLDVGLEAELEPRVLLAVVQFAFFGPADREGHVRFAHEIVADFLAARHALRMIRANPMSADGLGQALGVRRDLERSIVLRYLARGLAAEPELAGMVRAVIEGGRVRDTHAANARLLLRKLDEAGA